jgi:hypothetical protein
MRKIVFTLTAILVIICLMEPMAQVLLIKANPLAYYDIYISSPHPSSERIYSNTTIPLSLSVLVPKGYSEISSIYYSLDGNDNYTLIISKSSDRYSASDSLVNLSEGNHTLKVYANNVYGMAISTEETFTVNTTFRYATVTIISPLNQTYTKNEIPLIYTVNGKILLAKYSMDYPPMNDVNGNLTLTQLSDGPHKILLSVEAENGYTSNTTYFNINTTRTDNGLTLDQTSTIVIAITAIVIVAVLAIILYKGKQAKEPKTQSIL